MRKQFLAALDAADVYNRRTWLLWKLCQLYIKLKNEGK